MKLSRIFYALLLLFFKCYAFAGEPTLSPKITIVLPNGEQTTLFGDSNPKAKVLYFLPVRLSLKKRRGKPNFNAIVYRGITGIEIDQSFQETHVGKLGGGVVDCILELQGPTKDLEELRSYIKKQYPQYANYRIAQIPLIPGSASISLSHFPVVERVIPSLNGLNPEQKDKIRAINSGGEVSAQFGGVIPVRFRLSKVDALILTETLNNANSNDAFTAAFDVKFSAKTRINFPPTTVKITANKRKVYQYVENHFKAKGGFFFFSFNADIRKIRQKLEEDGHLDIQINRQHENISFEFLSSLADKWLEKYILKEMHQTQIDLPKARAQAADPKMGFFSWANLGTSYARVDIKQTIDKKASFSWTYQGVETLPIFAKAEFDGLGPSNIIQVDINDSFFAYGSFAAIPFTTDVMMDNLFGSAKFSFQINGNGNNSEIPRRVASFNRIQRQVYQTFFPLKFSASQASISKALTGKTISNITYNFSYNGPTASFTLKNLKFDHSNWEFDIPSVQLEDHLGHIDLKLTDPERLFNTFPNLRKVEVLIPSGDQEKKSINYILTTTNPSRSYFFDKRLPNLKSVKIRATYLAEDGFLTKTSEKKIGRLLKQIIIDETDIPKLTVLGK